MTTPRDIYNNNAKGSYKPNDRESQILGKNREISNPSYANFAELALKIEDCIDGGQVAIKNKMFYYLPRTAGQKKNWSTKNAGLESYSRYIFRAEFKNYPADALAKMTGQLSHKPHEVTLPKKWDYLNENATPTGESFVKMISNIENNQAKYGRSGLLADISKGGKWNLNVINPLSIVAWDYDFENKERDLNINYLVIDQSSYERVGASFEWLYSYRVHTLDENGIYYQALVNNDNYEEFKTCKDINKFFAEDERTYFEVNGSQIKFIPFKFFNVYDNNPETVNPPLMNIVDLSLSVFAHSADYKQALFLQGQATPVLSGFTEDEEGGDSLALGAEGLIAFGNPESKASMLEVSGAGLSEMREKEKALEATIGDEILKINQSGIQSGQAIDGLNNSKSSKLVSIVQTCENGIKSLLSQLADIDKVNTEEIQIKVNSEFTSHKATPAEAKTLMEAKGIGLMITDEDVYNYCKANGFTTAELEEVLNAKRETGAII